MRRGEDRKVLQAWVTREEMFWVVDAGVLRVISRLGEESRYITFTGSWGG